MESIDAFIKTIAQLRDPDSGCPWDLKQTHQSLCDNLIEESAEVLDAIDRNNMEDLTEELGDLLLQVVLHAQIASESGHFNFKKITDTVNQKIIRRHPHVFGEAEVKNMDELFEQWNAIKAEEKKKKIDRNNETTLTVFNKEPLKQLPALLYARDVCKLAHKNNFDVTQWIESEKAQENSPSEAELAMSLLKTVFMCQKQGIDPESLLCRTASKCLEAIRIE